MIYTIDGVLIYQVDNGGDNTAKLPLGGVIAQNTLASSMLTTIANPITYYYGSGAVINQDGHSGDLYNYYWTSYSRGTDGKGAYPTDEPNWHNAYLDGYIPLRVKSIYDPCPYLYRTPSNGTFNQFNSNPRWTLWSYLGGNNWIVDTHASWLSALGSRHPSNGAFDATGYRANLVLSTTANKTTSIVTVMYSEGFTLVHNMYARSQGLSVRCIEVTRRLPILFCRKKYAKNV